MEYKVYSKIYRSDTGKKLTMHCVGLTGKDTPPKTKKVRFRTIGGTLMEGDIISVDHQLKRIFIRSVFNFAEKKRKRDLVKLGYDHYMNTKNNTFYHRFWPSEIHRCKGGQNETNK